MELNFAESEIPIYLIGQALVSRLTVMLRKGRYYVTMPETRHQCFPAKA